MKKLLALLLCLATPAWATNPYIGANITSANSPARGADKNTYTTVFDTTIQKLDEHNHTSGKGLQIPTAGIQDLAVTTAKLATAAVSTAKIADLQVTLTKMAADSVNSSKIVDATIVQGDIATSGVSTVNLAPEAVTRAKLSPLGEQVTSAMSIGNATSYTNVTNGSLTITTTGRPVWVGFSASSSSLSQIQIVPGAAATGNLFFKLLRNGSSVYETNYNSAAAAGTMNHPPSTFSFIDRIVPSGTYTYTLQYKVGDALNTPSLDNVRMLSFEY